MKLISAVLATLLLLTGCSNNPSELACEVWNEKLQEASIPVDYWSELSSSRPLTLEEKRMAYQDQDSYIAVLREMNSVGCEN